jgi:superfamily II DNA or RNA helicase
MPTGSGKTIMGVSLIADRISLGKKLIVLVPQIEIFEQWMTACSSAGLKPGYINDEGVMGRGRDVYICMYQSLTNLLDTLPEKFCRGINEIITDETHHSSAQSFRAIYDHFSHCLRLGLTATPYRMDNMPLGEFYTDMIEPIKMSEAIDNGYLCKPVIIIPEIYQGHVPKQGDEIDKNEQKELIREKQIIGDMVTTYREVFNGLPVIVPCTTHKHAQDVTGQYMAAGWAVDHIHSKMAKYERRGVVRRVREGKTNILVTVGVGIEGMDIPGLYGIIWLRFTESLTIYMQFNGRAMRPAPGKEYFVMIDPVGNSVLHGRPDIDRKWSLDTDYVPGQDVSDAPQSRECRVCGVVNNIDNNKCWICGYDFATGMLDGEVVECKKRKLPRMVDGELVFLDDENNVVEGGNGDNNSNGSIGRDSGDTDVRGNGELTKAEKVNILKSDLTGVKLKNKFKDGLRWMG